MAVKKLKPTSPGSRYAILSTFDRVTASEPEKRLLKPSRSTGGRSKQGKMTVRGRGGGHKQRYRVVDFKRNKDGIPAKVKSIEYDPNRSALIALLYYADGDKRYILAPEGLEVGREVESGEKAEPNVGNTLPLKNIPLGTVIHNVELLPGKGGSLARSAGSYVQLLANDGRYSVIKLPSGETRMVPRDSKATIGSVSNSDHVLKVSGKAGRSRWKGKRPRTRGVAMNPVDHPMGGGEGKASGGHPRSRKGLSAKGFKTRKKNKASNKYIIERRKKR